MTYEFYHIILAIFAVSIHHINMAKKKIMIIGQVYIFTLPPCFSRLVFLYMAVRLHSAHHGLPE